MRATVERFVAARNAHDSVAVGGILLDSRNSLWIARMTAVCGRADASSRIQERYAGTWHLEPERAALRAVVTEPRVAEIFVPVVFTIGAAAEAAQETKFLMNMVLAKQDTDGRSQAFSRSQSLRRRSKEAAAPN
jgi:hypothetical protein